MSRAALLSVGLLAGCLTAPPAAGGGDGGGDRDDGGPPGDAAPSACHKLGSLAPIAPIGDALTALDGVVTVDLDGDGDLDLLAHGRSAASERLLVARLPQPGAELVYHELVALIGPATTAAFDTQAADGCAELVAVYPSGVGTDSTLQFFPQNVSLEAATAFELLSTMPIGLPSGTTPPLLTIADFVGAGVIGAVLATPDAAESLVQLDITPLVTAPSLAQIRWLGTTPAADGPGTDLVIAEAGRLRWMRPTRTGALQFSPRRVLTTTSELSTCASLDLDRDGYRDLACIGAALAGFVFDPDAEPSPTLTEAGLAEPLVAQDGALDAIVAANLTGGPADDLVVLDSPLGGEAALLLMTDPGVVAGTVLIPAPVRHMVFGFAARHLAVFDHDGDGAAELWLFDDAGQARCVAPDADGLLPCR